MSKAMLIKGLAVTALVTVTATGAIAADDTQWKVRVGVSNVDPKSNNGVLAGAQADVKDDTAITFNGVYMVRPNIGIELLAATPFKHDIALNGAVVGSTKHLPPTVSAQYYFNNNSRFTPYVGAGINYTKFFSEKSSLGNLSLKASWGLALQAGVDVDLNDQWLLNLDFRRIDIESDVKLNGGFIGKAKIDPTVISVNVGYKF